MLPFDEKSIKEIVDKDELNRIRWGYDTAFITSVGSDMWDMRVPESDVDIMRTYYVNPVKRLRGENIKSTIKDRKYVIGGIDIDEKGQELSHLVNKLIEGNVSAIWTVCSPVIVKNHVILDTLKKITKANLSKSSFRSINGISYSEFLDEERRKLPAGKSYRTCIRSCNFGIAMFEGKGVVFKGVDPSIVPTKDEAAKALQDLGIAHENSDLPEYPDEESFRSYLYDVNVTTLKR